LYFVGFTFVEHTGGEGGRGADGGARRKKIKIKKEK